MEAMKWLNGKGWPLSAVSTSPAMYLTARAQFKTDPPPVRDMPLNAPHIF